MPRRPSRRHPRAASARVGRGWLRALLPLVLLLPAAACARPAGDLGRADRNALHDEMLPAIGAVVSRGSEFNLTDEETEMRDRVWRYLVAPHAYDWFGDVAVEFQRTRIMPISSKPLGTDLYYGWLHSARFASSRVRYTRLEEDVIADVAMLPSAFASICAVVEIDRRRGIAWNQIGGLEAKVGVDAAKRHAENRAAIDWFVRALANRADSYGYALDHLLIETPHANAVGVDARLNDLALYVETAQRGDFCGAPRPGRGGDDGALRSRVLRSAPDEGPYRK